MLIITNKQFDKLVKRITEDARAPRATSFTPKFVSPSEDPERTFSKFIEARDLLP